MQIILIIKDLESVRMRMRAHTHVPLKLEIFMFMINDRKCAHAYANLFTNMHSIASEHVHVCRYRYIYS